MQRDSHLPVSQDKLLFTPGPLTTSQTVKQAMLRDLGSQDVEFLQLLREIRQELVSLAEVTSPEYTAIPMQGSGSYGVEAVIASTVAPGGKLMVISNGAYGERMVKTARMLQIDTLVFESPDDVAIDLEALRAVLQADPKVTQVAVVHGETTTGILNPIKEIGGVVKASGADYFVDAMSTFGALPIDMAEYRIDYLVSSPNKCLEGVPGFSFVIARLNRLLKTKGYARSLSLDILDQYHYLEATGQTRFTAPIQTLNAFRQALWELELEGGITARAQRYQANYRTLIDGMRQMGFREYLRPEDQGHFITSFHCPEDAHFRFEEFFRRLYERNYVIYPGKVTRAHCFRIGNIGRIFETDIRDLLAVIEETLTEMKVRLK